MAMDRSQRAGRETVADRRLGGNLWNLQLSEGIDGGPVYGRPDRVDSSGKFDFHVCGNAVVWPSWAVSGTYGISAD